MIGVLLCAGSDEWRESSCSRMSLVASRPSGVWGVSVGRWEQIGEEGEPGMRGRERKVMEEGGMRWGVAFLPITGMDMSIITASIVLSVSRNLSRASCPFVHRTCW